MQEQNAVEAYLEKISEGREKDLSKLLVRLARQILYTPVITFENIGDARGTNRIKVATFSSQGRNIVPCFTSEEYFLEWSDGKHQCFSVAGGDLALTLPPDTWLVINPGSSATVELAPEQVSVLADVDPFSLDADLGEPEQTVQADKPSEDAQASGSGAEAPSPVEEEGIRESCPVDIERLCRDLYEVLEKYSRVEEAYFYETRDGAAHGMLGLLTDRLNAEERFLLIDQIAELARKYFGAAGAIEVYDDLDVTSSKSWELFNTLTPFYVRGDKGRADGVLRIEKEFVLGDAEEAAAGDEDEASAWEEVRKTGARLFGALRIGGRG